MPSPFPGFDPYLEHPDFWPEVHSRLIVALADSLVPQVRPKYEVAIEKRIYEINSSNGDNSLLVGVPDLAVKRQPSHTNPSPSEIAVAVASFPVQPMTVTVPIPEKVNLHGLFTEIYDKAGYDYRVDYIYQDMKITANSLNKLLPHLIKAV